MVRRRTVLAALGGVGLSGVVLADRGVIDGVELPDVDEDRLPETDVDLPGEPWDADAAALSAHTATNDARREHGREPLDWSADIASIAKDYAGLMAEQNYYDHDSPDGTTPGERLREAGVGCYNGENIAKSHWKRETRPSYEGDEILFVDTPKKAGKNLVGLWMHSQGHRENILRRSNSREGIGLALDQENRVIYAVQDFC